MITQQLFSFNDVALRWGCSAFTVRRRVDDGSIKSVNVGARRMINLDEILRVEAGGAGKPKPASPRSYAPKRKKDSVKRTAVATA